MAKQPTDIHLNPLQVTWIVQLQYSLLKDYFTELKNYIHDFQILSTLESQLNDDSILVADGGDFVGSAAYIVKPRGPLRYVILDCYNAILSFSSLHRNSIVIYK